MPEFMLRPGWPGTFRRTISNGKKARVVEFASAVPVELTESEAKQLGTDLGNAVFEIMRDEKNRPRFVEAIPMSAPLREQMENEIAAHV